MASSSTLRRHSPRTAKPNGSVKNEIGVCIREYMQRLPSRLLDQPPDLNRLGYGGATYDNLSTVAEETAPLTLDDLPPPPTTDRSKTFDGRQALVKAADALRQHNDAIRKQAAQAATKAENARIQNLKTYAAAGKPERVAKMMGQMASMIGPTAETVGGDSKQRFGMTKRDGNRWAREDEIVGPDIYLQARKRKKRKRAVPKGLEPYVAYMRAHGRPAKKAVVLKWWASHG
jgi:hypothetical protein